MGKLPNDYKKGNRTKGNRETTAIQALNAAYKQEIDTYKRMAENRRATRRYRQEDLALYLGRVVEYIESKKDSGKPLTISGVTLAMKVNSEAFKGMRNGEYDYLLDEFITLNGVSEEEWEWIDGYPYWNGVAMFSYSEMLDMVYLMIQDQRETACSSLRGNPAGNIFLLKAQQGFREDEAPQTVNQTLVIADVDKAKEAMKLLGD